MRVSLVIWIAPSEKDTDNAALEKRLWSAADTATCVSANPEREFAMRRISTILDDCCFNDACRHHHAYLL